MFELIQTAVIVAIGIVVLLKEMPALTRRSAQQKAVILDSCALIDGRIIELVRAGFVPHTLIVPEFILSELQLLADGSDSHKRERARFGLEVVQQLQREPSVEVVVDKTVVKDRMNDDKLVTLANAIGADLFTTDFNLNQVASIKGIRVLNVNELSHALRPVSLPGENLEIRIMQPGSNRDQGVGYMEDGTMIVVDGARKDIGKTITVKTTRTHQTVAGKMVFATKIIQDKSRVHRTNKRVHQPRASKQENAFLSAIDEAHK
jgi:uncharacterized protein YacL